MNFRSLIAGAAVAIGLAAPAQAVTFDILATIGNGAFAGETLEGSFTYDETLLTGSGSETFGPVGSPLTEDASLAIEFTAGATIFSAFNDVDFPEFPQFLFDDGELTFINYIVVDGKNGADLLQFGVLEGSLEDNLVFNTNEQRYEVGVELVYANISAVPLPAGFPLLAAGLGALAFMRRRKT